RSDAAKTAAPSHTTGVFTSSCGAMRLSVNPGGDERGILLPHAIAKGRHHAVAAAPDGVGDVLQTPAIEPRAVRQVRRAERGVAARVAAMAGGAVLDEQHLPGAQRIGVGGDQLDGFAANALAQRRLQPAIRLLPARELVARGPAERAGGCAEPRIEHEITQ